MPTADFSPTGGVRRPAARRSKSMASGLRISNASIATSAPSAYSYDRRSNATVQSDISALLNELQDAFSYPSTDLPLSASLVNGGRSTHFSSHTARLSSVSEASEVLDPMIQPIAIRSKPGRQPVKSSPIVIKSLETVVDKWRPLRASIIMYKANTVAFDDLTALARRYLEALQSCLQSMSALPTRQQETREYIHLRDQILDLSNKLSIAKLPSPENIKRLCESLHSATKSCANLMAEAFAFVCREKPLPSIPAVEDGCEVVEAERNVDGLTTSVGDRACKVSTDCSDERNSSVGGHGMADFDAGTDLDVQKLSPYRREPLADISRVDGTFDPLLDTFERVTGKLWCSTSKSSETSPTPGTESSSSSPRLSTSSENSCHSEGLSDESAGTTCSVASNVIIADKSNGSSIDVISNSARCKLHSILRLGERPADTLNITYATDVKGEHHIYYISLLELIINICKTSGCAELRRIVLRTRLLWLSALDFVKEIRATFYIEQRFCDEPLLAVQRNVVLLVNDWVISHWRGKFDEEAKSELIDLLKEMQNGTEPGLQNQIYSIIRLLKNKSATRSIHEKPSDEPIYTDKATNSKKIDILDLDGRRTCIELAQQLTLYEASLYNVINAEEMMIGALRPKFMDVENEKRMEDHRVFLDRLEAWVNEAFLSESDPVKRAKVFTHLVRLVSRLHALRCFSSAQTIMNSLSCHRVALSERDSLTGEEITPTTCMPVTYQHIEKGVRDRFLNLEEFYFNLVKGSETLPRDEKPMILLISNIRKKFIMWAENKKASDFVPSSQDSTVQLFNVFRYRQLVVAMQELERSQKPYDLRVRGSLQASIQRSLEDVDSQYTNTDFLSEKRSSLRKEELSVPAARFRVRPKLMKSISTIFPARNRAGSKSSAEDV